MDKRQKDQPTPARKVAVARQRERGEGLRSWLQDRATVLVEAQKKRREERAEKRFETAVVVPYVAPRAYVNPDRDRSLSGKARIRARKAARQ